MPDNSVTATVGASAPEAVFPEVEPLTAEAMEGGEEELLMYESSTTGALPPSSSLDVETNHGGKGVGAGSNPSRYLHL